MSSVGIRTDVPASRNNPEEDDNVQITMVRFETEQKSSKDRHRNRRQKSTAKPAHRTPVKPAENSYVFVCNIPASSTASDNACLSQGSEVGGRPTISISAPLPEQTGGSHDPGQSIPAPLAGASPDQSSSQSTQVSASQIHLLHAQCGQRLVIEIPPRNEN